ncbi:FKBP-type peptidyl-prolyl cis-trans isomerase [Viscerimonas tarda]
MKKIFLIAIFAVLCGNLFSQKSNKNLSIKTEIDSISYAYGIGLAQQGLNQYISQLGVIADTTGIRATYNANIAAETSPAQKAKLEKELNFKLDSINKVNTKNIALFADGITARFKAKDNNSAYFEGTSIGSQLTKMIPSFSAQLYGDDKKNEINNDLVLLGLISALKNQKLLMDDSFNFVEKKMAAAQEKLNEEKAEKLKLQYADEIAKGEQFFQGNKARPGVTTLPDGLQYQIVKEGTGAKPTINDRVKVHYKGTLLDGTVFDSSIDRGEPAIFGVGQVIKGWTEVLQLMPVGSKWIVFIPYNLGYGATGAGDKIKPFSDLIFEVELLGIE